VLALGCRINSEKMAHRNAGRWLNKCGNMKRTKYATSGQIRKISVISEPPSDGFAAFLHVIYGYQLALSEPEFFEP
jgi:hypothetical protein